jgi:DNA-binding NarL/FixJ family response regulator
MCGHPEDAAQPGQREEAAPPVLRILLAAGPLMVCEAIQVLLEREADFSVVAHTVDADEVVPLAERLLPDVLVLDLMIPGMDGIEVAQEVARRGVSVVIVSIHTREACVLTMLKSGALGYVVKHSPARELVRAIREVAAGRQYLGFPLSEWEVEAYARLAEGALPDPYTTLTSREREVFRLVATGHTNAEIAGRLGIGRRTVESYRANFMKKLGLRSPVAVAHFAVHQGLLPPERVDDRGDMGPVRPCGCCGSVTSIPRPVIPSRLLRVSCATAPNSVPTGS